MAVSAKAYGALFTRLVSAGINWSADTIKVMLTTATYTPDQDAHDYKDDVTNEVTGTGYTAGGATLASKTNAYTGGTNTLALDAADVTWAASTITARYAVIYKDTGTAATSPLIGYVDLDGNISSTNGPFTLTWDSAGIVTLTTA